MKKEYFLGFVIASEVSLELLYDVDVEGGVGFFAKGFEVGENAVLGTRTKRSLEKSLEAGQTMGVVGQAEMAEIQDGKANLICSVGLSGANLAH